MGSLIDDTVIDASRVRPEEARTVMDINFLAANSSDVEGSVLC